MSISALTPSAWIQQSVAKAAQLTCDSRLVTRGDVFIAYPGHAADGRHYIAQAINNGAAAVVYEAQDADVQLTTLSVPALAVQNLKTQAGHIAAEYYAHPSNHIRVVGITGTSGKSSVALWLAHALRLLGEKAGVIGTLGAGMVGVNGQALAEFGNTTPDAVYLQRILAHLRDQGVTHVAMEVTSIGLVDGRLNGMQFVTAALTNLSRDHLDYHGTLAAYEAAKTQLFAWPQLQHAVINLDDEVGQRIAKHALQHGAHVLGTSLLAQAQAQLKLDQLETNASGIQAQLEVNAAASEPQHIQFNSPMMGRFNAENLLIVLGCLVSMGYDVRVAAHVLAQLPPVPGRMEKVHSQHGPLVLVDYAHKPDALEKALLTCKPIAQKQNGRLIAVFGCGGDRDRGKRPMMGAIAARLADHIVLTSDNPRSEDPNAILNEIAAGMDGYSNYIIVADRAQAIAQSIAQAASQDLILIAGKGHESYQIIGKVTSDFSDQAHASAALNLWSDHGVATATHQPSALGVKP